MQTAKQDVEQLLKRFPDDCSYEDIEYHRPVLGEVCRGLEEAKTSGTSPQNEAEAHLSTWLTDV